jgi:hypothetical protein
MRTPNQRAQDRAAFLTPPYEEPAVMLAHAIAELCRTLDEASEEITEAQDDTRRAIDQLKVTLVKEAARA